MQETYFPISVDEQRFNKSSWRIFPLKHGAVVVTEMGQNVIREHPELLTTLHNYRTEVKTHGRTSTSERKYFKHGGNSDVYTVGDTSMVIKEAGQAHSVWSALDRMDYLYSICENDLPPHIRVPAHYGAVFSRNLENQYLLMGKANEGVTVQDLIDSQEYSQPQKAFVQDKYDETKLLLDKAIDMFNTKNEMERSLLPDWHQGNVIVDFTTPNEVLPFTFWIIDQ